MWRWVFKISQVLGKLWEIKIPFKVPNVRKHFVTEGIKRERAFSFILFFFFSLGKLNYLNIIAFLLVDQMFTKMIHALFKIKLTRLFLTTYKQWLMKFCGMLNNEQMRIMWEIKVVQRTKLCPFATLLSFCFI